MTNEEAIEVLKCCITDDCENCQMKAENAYICAESSFAPTFVEVPKDVLLQVLERPKERQWISVKDRLPENEKDVLLIKQLKSGQRNIGIGYCIADYEFKNYATGETWRAPYWVCSGNNNVVYWMPLPEMPKEEEE